MSRNSMDLTNQDFGDLHIIKRVGKAKSGQILWQGIYKKSKIKVDVPASDLRTGKYCVIDPIERPMMMVPPKLKNIVRKMHERNGTTPPPFRKFKNERKTTNYQTPDNPEMVEIGPSKGKGKRKPVDRRTIRKAVKQVVGDRVQREEVLSKASPINAVLTEIGIAMSSIESSMNVIRREMESIHTNAETLVKTLKKIA